jgi:ABC-2 type transport system ATP-binding protein
MIGDTDQPAIIAARNLRKDFGEIHAVRGISFEVRKGAIFAFLGPNGAGKTTTIKMLTTLLTPTEGTAVLDGHDVGTHPRAARRSFGIVFQDPSLDDELTARENMDLHAVLYRVPRAVRRERISRLLEIVQLADRQNDRVKFFSGGMKRRLEIARGLLHHPRVLFLDEPTQGLDPQTRNGIWEHIRGLNRDESVTVFFTTHYMEEAERVAEEVAIIDHGAIVAEGTPAALRERTGAATLEDAFLALTGRTIRDEEASSLDMLRMGSRMWRRRR